MRRLSPEPFGFAHRTGPTGSRLAGALRAAAIVALSALAVPALAQETGRAGATGSDTLVLNGHDYQLFGIDGLEFNQSCFVDGRPLACGASAVRALQTLLEPVAITCTTKGNAPSGVPLATCATPDGDVGMSLVQQGWAVADPAESTDYVAAEATAREGKVGAWQGTFLPPKAYDQQIAAIEADYGKVAADTARVDAERTLVAGRITFPGLGDVTPEFVDVAASSAPVPEREVTYNKFRPGFIDAAAQPPDVFDWSKVAGVLEANRVKGVTAIEDNVVRTVWDELAARPSETIQTHDSDTFYAALKTSAAKWIAAKRQPVLFILSPDTPQWMRDWFGGKAPAGAVIEKRRDFTGSQYLGTVDGIDVFMGGPSRDRGALLVPSDILAGVTYGKNADGNVLALEVNTDQDWVLRYHMGLRWLDDTVTWLAYPAAAASTPDA